CPPPASSHRPGVPRRRTLGSWASGWPRSWDSGSVRSTSALRTLTVRDSINEVEGRLVDGKGKTEAAHRTISVPQSLLNELAEHRGRTGRSRPGALVVPAPGGGPIRATNFRRRV